MSWVLFLTLSVGFLLLLLFIGLPIFVGFLILNVTALLVLMARAVSDFSPTAFTKQRRRRRW